MINNKRKLTTMRGKKWGGGKSRGFYFNAG